MSKLLKEHLEGLLVDLAQAQDILDKVLTYNTDGGFVVGQ